MNAFLAASVFVALLPLSVAFFMALGGDQAQEPPKHARKGLRLVRGGRVHGR